MYKQEDIEVKLVIKPIKFRDYRPLEMEKYEQLVTENSEIFQGILYEKGAADGQGWIGLPAETGSEVIAGRFITYLHRGAYNQLKGIFQKISNDYPKAQEFYLVYLNSPQEVAPEGLETKIIFR